MDSEEYREELADRLLGAKVSIQEVLEILEPGDQYDVFDRALDLAMEMEQELEA